jgi:C4-dicarboxylate-specific signal transduction histidine kinase
MNDEIMQHNDNLERQVESRTRDLKEAYEHLVEQKQALIASSKMAALGEMAGGIAHEINTPLGIFSLCADNLKELLTQPEIDREIISETVQTVESTTARISKIIQGLRRFSRDASSDPVVAIPVQEIVSDAIALCQEQLAAQGIRLDVPKVSPHICVAGRSVELTQVLLNLLNNSRDAIESLNDKWIRLDCRETAGAIEISVTDSGSGIPIEVQQKLMQPFFTTKAIGKGTGLGLSISKGIIESHGGTLTYDTACTNTRFIMRLPI